MAQSRWSGQKSAAAAQIRQLLADGQEKDVETLTGALKASGLTHKNALKALYLAVQDGAAALIGTWSDPKFRKGGA